MKINIKILSFVTLFVILSVTLCSFNNKFLEMEGTSNNYGGKAQEAVNSAYAKTQNNDIILTNDPMYKTPNLVTKLPLRKPIETGGAEMAEELPSVENYYDGALGIKHSVSFCNQFITKPQACVNQGSCGWCMGNGNCVSGNSNGPINEKDCLRGKYVFEAPNKDWNPITIPNTRLERTNVMGAQLTTIVQQP